MNVIENSFLEQNFYYQDRKKQMDKIPSIVNFSFIRNIFENKLFKKDFAMNRKNYEKIDLQKIEFEKVKNFVKDRYLKDPDKKMYLFTRDDVRRNYFEKIISGIWDKEDVLKWLLVWVYRLRNNYFHWEKKLESEENELFENANLFMIECFNSYWNN